MKTIELSIWERLNIFGIISAQGGQLDRVRKLLRILDVIDFSEDEIKKIKLTKTILPNNSVTYDWDRKIENKNFTLEFEDEHAELLKEILKNYTNWIVDKRVITLMDKVEKL